MEGSEVVGGRRSLMYNAREVNRLGRDGRRGRLHIDDLLHGCRADCHGDVASGTRRRPSHRIGRRQTRSAVMVTQRDPVEFIEAELSVVVTSGLALQRDPTESTVMFAAGTRPALGS